MGFSLKKWAAKLFGINTAMAVQQAALLKGLPVYNTANAVGNIQNGYCGSDDVYSIVSFIAQTISMIPMKVYKVID